MSFGALGDETHLVFECSALASLRSRYADLFTSNTDIMRSFFAQPDHMGVFPLCHRLSGFYEDLNMIAMIGTSDQPCWLAEACKILLLLLLVAQAVFRHNIKTEFCLMSYVAQAAMHTLFQSEQTPLLPCIVRCGTVLYEAGLTTELKTSATCAFDGYDQASDEQPRET